MRSDLMLALVLFALTPFSAHGQSSGASPDDPAPRFPPLTAENLLGEGFNLPGDLPGDLQVVHVAFRQRQQGEVNTWLEITDALEADFDGLRVFEFPTISWPFRLMKPVIDNGMRSGIPSTAARFRTITIFTNVADFVEATGLPGTADIATLLLGPEGRIRFSVTGVRTREREEALRGAIRGLSEAGGPR